MRCRECGAILLDTDTFCGKCGTKVKVNICPECGITLRPGMRFCANCGYEVLRAEDILEKEDDDIPVTGGLKTTEIPFDLIEQSIIKDVERQLDVPVANQGQSDDYFHQAASFEEDADYAEDNYDSYESDNDYDGYESEENYEEYDDGYDENYDGSYVEEDDFYEDEPQSLASRLLTAAMIVIGLIILIIVASFFFKNRDSKQDNEPTIEENTETDEEDESEAADSVIGTIEIIKNVNIRSTPDSSEDSNKIGIATVGETYSYFGFADNNNNWVHIKVDDNTDGYVYKDYIKIKE